LLRSRFSPRPIAARSKEESLASEHGLEDFSPCPERVVSEVSPTGVGTIKGDENGWRHHGAGVWTAQQVATGKEVLIEHRDFPVQDQRGGRQQCDRSC